MNVNVTVSELYASVIEALDANDIDESVARAKEFFDHTIRCGQQTEDRAWVALRLAVLWYNDKEAAPATVWTHRALMEGPRADAFALLGEIARLEEDWPLAAKWFEIARTALCPARCIRSVMEELPARIDEHRRDLLVRRVEYGYPSSDHIFAIMTCDGRAKLYRDALHSLQAGKLNYEIDTFLDEDLRGQAFNFFEVLRHVELVDDGYLTIFEDDTLAVKNTIEYIACTVMPPDVAMASWFHKLAPAQPMRDPYWLVERAANFSCNQAITMPMSTVRALLDSKELQAWSEPHGADMLIGKVMPDALVAYHFPNLVQHVGGEQSLVGNVEARTSPTFPGEDFDALGLRDLTR